MRAATLILLGVLAGGVLGSTVARSAEVAAEQRRQALGAPKPGQAVVCAVGDLIFTRSIAGIDKPDHTGLYRILQTADITCGNLEMSLNTQPDRGVYTFVKDPAFASEIARMGFNVLGLANNHQLDFGPAGLVECMAALQQAQLRYAGGGHTLQASQLPTYLKKEAVTVAFLSFYSEEFHSLARPAGKTPTIATIRAPRVWLEKDDGSQEIALAPLEEDVRAMEDAIRLARRNADIVMVALHVHWVDHASVHGVPAFVPPNQALLFRRAAAAGADILLGSGPHVLRGIEVYRGTVIFYSLGNFIYQYKKDHIPAKIYRRDPQQDRKEEFQSIVARITLEQKKIRAVQLIPVVLDEAGPDYGTPRLAGPAQGRHILNALAELSAEYGSEITLEDTHGILNLR